MKQGLKRILSIFMLLVFIVPATGMMLYVHHCSMSNITRISSSTPEHCCSDTCSSAHDLYDAHHAVIKKIPCCNDSKVFVKLGAHLFAQGMKVPGGDYAVMNFNSSTTNLLATTGVDAGTSIKYMPVQSGGPPFLLFASFRL
ncbi:MAG TPA: hypothetical protein VK172_03735 [Lentimicrobium sp.]|jgi:hypothetical protein|nr:hypothetical protein [Lentimicrobium sp.]